MRTGFFFALSVCSQLLFADKFLVVFRQTELISGGLEHVEMQGALQKTNEKSVEQLQKWFETRASAGKVVAALWLMRGAIIEADEKTAKNLKREPWIEQIRLDQIRKLINPSPNLKVATSLSDLGEDPQNLWGLRRIGLPQLHIEFPNIKGTDVRVGVLDTGVQSKHPELADRVIAFKDFVNHIHSPYDDQGHGTHVSGTIAGQNVGIAPGVSLIVGKVFSAAGVGSDSSLLRAMQWISDPDGNPATQDHPQIVSNSWGGDIPNAINDVSEFLPYQIAIQNWIQMGIIPVFAAGNSGQTPNGFPGGLPEPIAVGAFGDGDKLADFSSRGPNLWLIGQYVMSVSKPDLSAPGVAITSAFPGNKYATWDGTSMATPHVTGVIALALQLNPKLTFADVKSHLMLSVDPKVDFGFGFGVLNALALLKSVKGRLH